MRMRRKAWARPELDACDFFIKDPISQKDNWKNVFKNSENEIHLELGCGKGVFLKDISLINRNINYIAIDISSDILGVAKRNIEKAFNELNAIPDNIALVAQDIESINDIIGKEDKISRIYINFCNPWPKKRHKKRRLTHTTKLNKYKEFVAKDALLYFKTDDDELFEETQEYLKECNMEITYITYDLHNSDFKENYLTEHEIMFTNEGIPTKFLIAKFFND